EPPRRLRFCGVSPVPLFRQESSPCPPINCARRNETDESYVHHKKSRTNWILNQKSNSFGPFFN
ncbi:MAG: hypothetical protein ABS933_15325, partial [Priestia megaterium]